MASAAISIRRWSLLGAITVFLTLAALVGSGAAAADTTPPDAKVKVPGPGQVFTTSPLTLSGNATDNVGVAAVDVAIKDRSTGRWLRADGTWGAFVWLRGRLGAPSATWTRWTLPFAAPTGLFAVTVRARDAAGNVDPTRPWVRFDVRLTPTPTSGPDVVLILTDDQRADTLSVMPNVRSLLRDPGVTFTNGFVANALCCPSRANILKGAYSHSTRVYQNGGTYGPMSSFDDRSTMATWLDGGGYRTGFVGKYFNGYDPSRASYVPPGWDRWVAFATTDIGGGRFFDYGLSIDGAYRTYGSATADYSTDVLASFAESFIRSTPADTPLFLEFAPYAPHEPATPAPRHATTFGDLPTHRPPNFGEADVSDKPAYIRSIPPLQQGNLDRIDSIRRKQHQSLLAVDEAVGRVVQALKDTGRLATTMIVFTSDNGFLWGEHRWGTTGQMNKQVPYEESIRVPFVVRYDPLVTTPRTDPNLVLNIDIAPTFAALAGVGAPGAEGSSLLPLLASPTAVWRSDFLIEHHITNVPSYCAVRSQSAIYVRYGTGEQEFYPLATDPFQLVNRASDPAYAQTVSAMRARAQTLCSPPPPGYSFISATSIAQVQHISTK